MQKTISFGTCNACGAETKKIMQYLDAPDTVRGITLEAGTKDTGYWVWCTNTQCEYHHGEGTLKSRSRDIS